MIEIALLLLDGILAAFLTIFLNYCFGKPGSKEFSPYEIFSFYSVWLAKMRLKQVGLFDQYSEQYHENIKRHETKAGTITMKNDFNKMVYDAAEPFFTWERAAGMCVNCFGVWVSGISGILFFIYKQISVSGILSLLIIFVYLLIIIVVSHVTIRILNKII